MTAIVRPCARAMPTRETPPPVNRSATIEPAPMKMRARVPMNSARARRESGYMERDLLPQSEVARKLRGILLCTRRPGLRTRREQPYGDANRQPLPPSRASACERRRGGDRNHLDRIEH